METWHDRHKKESSLAQKVADTVSGFVGSWTFLIIHIIWFAAWIVCNVEPFPYGLLTMIVSLEAILLSTVIMISQTRAGDRDRVQAMQDYKTNERAKEEIEELMTVLARIETEKLDKIVSQIQSLKAFDKKLTKALKT